MAFYPDVAPGEPFQPGARLSNDIRHLLNGLNGFRSGAFGANSSGTVRIQVYNATGETAAAGSAVAFDDSKAAADNAVPLKAFSDPKKPWGVVTQSLNPGEIGDCIISGPVTVPVSGSGDFALPSVSGFQRGAEGAPVLHAHGGRAIINLGAGTPEVYDGPFALSFDTESGLIRIKEGYISRNGEFLKTLPGEIAPSEGLVCVSTQLSEAGWSEPVFLVCEPDKYSCPVGLCKVTDDTVSVQSFRVPVAVFIDTAVCPLSTDYQE